MECPATCVRHLTWLSLQYPRGASMLLIYCKVMNTKSISDPEYLMCIFRIKLININIKIFNGFAIIVNLSAKF